MSEPVHEYASNSAPAGSGSPGDAGARYLREAEQIARVLKVLRDQRAEIQLSFEDAPFSCTAKILDVLAGTFLLEDVQPREGLRHLRSGSPFAMHARAHGIYLHCAGNHVVKVDSERGVPFFHVALPESVLYQQRRRSARFRLPLRVATNGASVMLFRSCDLERPMIGRVIDVSVGGCRAEFDGPAVPDLEIDERLENCAISIPNLLELNAQAMVRHHNYDKARHVLTCGIELTEMHVTDRRRLEQFIQSIARISQQA